MMDGSTIDIKRSPVVDYIMSRLSKECPDYLISMTDFEWMGEINKVHGKRKITNGSLVDAVDQALPDEDDYAEKMKKFPALCDPYELLIDAGICDSKLTPL